MSSADMTPRIQPVYTWETRVATYEVGPDCLLRPSALLQLQQEAGERQLGEGGLDWRGLAEQGMAFVVARSRISICRLPRMGEHIAVQTWHRDTRGARFHRCYRLLDADGQPLTEGVGEFALVDIHTHRLLRADRFTALGVEEQRRTCGCPDPERPLPPPLHEAGTHTVRRSQTDFNGHYNNTCYADLLCDFAPPSERPLRGLALWYHHEVRAGETLTVQAGVDGDTAFVRASAGETVCFDGALYR